MAPSTDLRQERYGIRGGQFDAIRRFLEECQRPSSFKLTSEMQSRSSDRFCVGCLVHGLHCPVASQVTSACGYHHCHGMQFPSLPQPFGHTAALQQTFVTQKPLAQIAAVVHVVPLAPLHVPLAVHTLPDEDGQESGSALPAATAAQVPLPFRLHAEQVPQLAELQQTPSTQLPLAQLVAVAGVHAVPLGSLHALVAVHTLPDEDGQESGSALPAATAEQVPLPFKLHAWHVPQLAELQQTPSTQLPLAHVAAIEAVHEAPLGAQQAPLPSQVAKHVSGSVFPLETAEQVPLPFKLQAWHVPQLDELQQTPSTQLPLMQEFGLLAVQVAPLVDRQLPEPSQS